MMKRARALSVSTNNSNDLLTNWKEYSTENIIFFLPQQRFVMKN